LLVPRSHVCIPILPLHTIHPLFSSFISIRDVNDKRVSMAINNEGTLFSTRSIYEITRLHLYA
jgi:hypothetical protein